MGQIVPLAPPRTAPARSMHRAFLPATLELLETPPSPTLRIVSLSMVALVGLALAWSWFSKVEIVALAVGKVVPIGQVKLIQPLETSVVRSVNVVEGDLVRVGQILVDLDPTDATADLEVTKADRVQAILDAEAATVLLSEGGDGTIRPMPGVGEDLREATQLQVRLKLEAHRATVSALRSEVADKRAAKEAKSIDVAKNLQLTPLAENRYETQKGLFDRGNSSRLSLLQAQYEMIDRKAEGRSLPHQMNQLDAEIVGLEHKISEARAQFLKEAAEQKLKALQKRASLDQTLRKATEREALRHLTSPVDGYVHDLKTNTLGGVVTAADRLMTIVPVDSILEVEAMVQHQEMGFVHQGQPAEVKFDAFPFTRYGTIQGEVRLIASNATERSQRGNGGQQSSEDAGSDSQGYRILVRLASPVVEAQYQKMPLRPGMTAQVDIKTGMRRVMEFLAEPVKKHVLEAGHER